MEPWAYQLMDLQMPRVEVIEAIQRIRQVDAAAKVIVPPTYTGDVRAVRALQSGACGYLLKSGLRRELVDTIGDVGNCCQALAPRPDKAKRVIGPLHAEANVESTPPQKPHSHLRMDLLALPYPSSAAGEPLQYGFHRPLITIPTIALCHWRSVIYFLNAFRGNAMLRHSLRVRLLLPVLALGLVVMSGLTVVLAFTEAKRIESETQAVIGRTSILAQTMFSLTRTMLLDRVNASIRHLHKESDALGMASQGNEVRVGGRIANDLLLGQKSQANTFGLVDSAASILVDDGASSSKQGNATLFSRVGDDFVRISTSFTNADGRRAVGSVLDPNSQAAIKLRNGESFYGVVDILGNPYVAGYEPIFAGNEKRVIGAWGVAHKADTPELATVIGSRRVLSSGFVAVLDIKNKLRFQSNTGSTTDRATIERIVKEKPQDWVVVKEEIRDWGFTLVSAYPKSDLNALILHQSLWIAGIGLLICALMVGVQSALIWNRVLRPVQNLTAVAEELSMGKWNHTIAEVNLKDEIGTLARAISRLSNSVRLAMERLNKR